MKIIHFAEALKGGPATYIESLARHQLTYADEVVIFCRESERNQINVPGVNVVTFPDTDRSLKGVIKLSLHWWSHIRANNYDIAHLHSTFAGIAGRVTPKKKRMKVIYCPHGWSFGMDARFMNKLIFKTVESALSSRCDYIICISKNEALLARSALIREGKIELIYNGIPDATWSPLPDGLSVSKLLYVGRYDYQKGVDILLKASSELRQYGYAITMIGGRVQSAGELIIPDWISDRGWLAPKEISAAMDDAHIVLMPSRWEGLSLVALEAMRSGRPIIASDISSLPEQVIHEKTGLLFKCGDPHDLVQSVINITSMNVAELGRNSREVFETKFMAHEMLSKIDKIYDRAILQKAHK